MKRETPYVVNFALAASAVIAILYVVQKLAVAQALPPPRAPS